MNIDEILDSVAEEIEKSADSPKATEPDETVDVSPGSIEKLASYLEAYSEEDTLVDDLAKLAVLNDRVSLAVLKKRMQGNEEEEKND